MIAITVKGLADTYTFLDDVELVFRRKALAFFISSCIFLTTSKVPYNISIPSITLLEVAMTTRTVWIPVS